MSDAALSELTGFNGPDEQGNYSCQQCGSEVFGPRTFVLQHYAWHIRDDLDRMPDCAGCGEMMAPAQGDPVRIVVNLQGMRDIEFEQGGWQCGNEECPMLGIEVLSASPEN